MFKRTHISQTETLRAISPLIWKVLSKKYKQGFDSIGIEMPHGEDEFTDEFWETLANTFKTFEINSETSALVEFLDDLEAFIQADAAVNETIQNISDQDGIEERFVNEHNLPKNKELSLTELAVIMLLDAKAAGRLRALRACISVDKSAFRYYTCKTEVPFQAPTPSELAELATKFKTELKEKLKLKDFCRIDQVDRKTTIFVSDEQGVHEYTVTEWWFSIQRTSRPVISPHVDKEDIKTITYIPPTTDIIVVNATTRTISTNVPAKRRRDVYLNEFAKAVLPKGVHYELAESATFTFKPLETDCWENLFTINGNDDLKHIRLKEVRCMLQKSGGVYEHIDRASPRRCLAVLSQGNRDEDKLRFVNINRVHLEFVFAGESSSPTLVKILSGNQISINRKHRRPDVQKWLQERGFVNMPKDSEDEEEA